MIYEKASFNFYDQGSSVTRLEAAFLLGRHRVRYGWHFIQHELMNASLLMGGEDPRLRRMMNGERAHCSNVYAAICNRAASFLSNSELARLIAIPETFRANRNHDEYLPELQEFLDLMDLRELHEASDDIHTPFVEEFIEAPYLSEIERTLRKGFDDSAGRWFDIGVAAERILCPDKRWKCLVSSEYWRRAERERYYECLHFSFSDPAVDEVAIFGDRRSTHSDRHIRLMRFSCPPGRARVDNEIDALEGRIQVAVGDQLSSAFQSLKTLLTGPRLFAIKPVTECETRAVNETISNLKRLVESIDGSATSLEEADICIDHAKLLLKRILSSNNNRIDPVDAHEANLAVEKFHAAVCGFLAAASGQEPKNVFEYSGLRFDKTNLRVTREGWTETVKIKRGQQAYFLSKLIEAQGEFVAHDQLLYNSVADPINRAQTVASNLRTNLKSLGADIKNGTLVYRLLLN